MEKQKPGHSRRDFLKLAGTAAPAAAIAVAAGTDPAAAVEAVRGNALPKTEHVRKYLDSARF